ncbi:hypothetical protein SNEBB_006709 [Seison nebaliae]|nr:hypothetical protein SNEBB_006709 [Seison nebaliae]
MLNVECNQLLFYLLTSEISLRRRNRTQPISLRGLKVYLRNYFDYTKQTNEADIYINKILIQKVTGRNWKDYYDTICSDMGIHRAEMVDKIWSPYSELIKLGSEIAFSVLSVDSSNDFTGRIDRGLQQISLPVLDSFESKRAIKEMVVQLKDKQVFNDNFLLMINSGTDTHFSLYAFDFQKERLISFESVDSNSYENHLVHQNDNCAGVLYKNVPSEDCPCLQSENEIKQYLKTNKRKLSKFCKRKLLEIISFQRKKITQTIHNNFIYNWHDIELIKELNEIPYYFVQQTCKNWNNFKTSLNTTLSSSQLKEIRFNLKTIYETDIFSDDVFTQWLLDSMNAQQKVYLECRVNLYMIYHSQLNPNMVWLEMMRMSMGEMLGNFILYVPSTYLEYWFNEHHTFHEYLPRKFHKGTYRLFILKLSHNQIKLSDRIFHLLIDQLNDIEITSTDWLLYGKKDKTYRLNLIMKNWKNKQKSNSLFDEYQNKLSPYYEGCHSKKYAEIFLNFHFKSPNSNGFILIELCLKSIDKNDYGQFSYMFIKNLLKFYEQYKNHRTFSSLITNLLCHYSITLYLTDDLPNSINICLTNELEEIRYINENWERFHESKRIKYLKYLQQLRKDEKVRIFYKFFSLEYLNPKLLSFFPNEWFKNFHFNVFLKILQIKSNGKIKYYSNKIWLLLLNKLSTYHYYLPGRNYDFYEINFLLKNYNFIFQQTNILNSFTTKQLEYLKKQINLPQFIYPIDGELISLNSNIHQFILKDAKWNFDKLNSFPFQFTHQFNGIDDGKSVTEEMDYYFEKIIDISLNDSLRLCDEISLENRRQLTNNILNQYQKKFPADFLMEILPIHLSSSLSAYFIDELPRNLEYFNYLERSSRNFNCLSKRKIDLIALARLFKETRHLISSPIELNFHFQQMIYLLPFIDDVPINFSLNQISQELSKFYEFSLLNNVEYIENYQSLTRDDYDFIKESVGKYLKKNNRLSIELSSISEFESDSISHLNLALPFFFHRNEIPKNLNISTNSINAIPFEYWSIGNSRNFFKYLSNLDNSLKDYHPHIISLFPLKKFKEYFRSMRQIQFLKFQSVLLVEEKEKLKHVLHIQKQEHFHSNDIHQFAYIFCLFLPFESKENFWIKNKDKFNEIDYSIFNYYIRNSLDLCPNGILRNFRQFSQFDNILQFPEVFMRLNGHQINQPLDNKHLSILPSSTWEYCPIYPGFLCHISLEITLGNLKNELYPFSWQSAQFLQKCLVKTPMKYLELCSKWIQKNNTILQLTRHYQIRHQSSLVDDRETLIDKFNENTIKNFQQQKYGTFIRNTYGSIEYVTRLKYKVIWNSVNKFLSIPFHNSITRHSIISNVSDKLRSDKMNLYLIILVWNSLC